MFFSSSTTRIAAGGMVVAAKYHASASVLAGLAEAELLHLRLEALPRDLEEPRGVRDVPARLLERPHDQLLLDLRRRLADELLQADLAARGRLHGGRIAARHRRRVGLRAGRR